MTGVQTCALPIFLNEAERSEFVALIDQSPRRIISAASVLEAAMVLEGRKGADAGADLDIFLQRAAVETFPFDEEQLELARLAFRRYGKGKNPAGLNFGDCISYALSRSTGEPLLYKGTDFSSTDVASAR